MIIAEEDGYTAEADAGALLAGLGIPTAAVDGLMRELPGGLKLRVLLAQALFGKPEVLLLDEPTNNLDLDSIRWLEGFLCSYEGVLVTISHDRHFLNTICTHIADIDYSTIITYTGSYDEMVMAKSQVRARVESENADRQKKIAQLQDFVARFGAGTRASQVQSRKRQIEKLAVTELKKSNIERPFIHLQIKKPSGKQTLTVEGLSKRWPDALVCKDFNALVTKGEKIAIVGRNGAGKTTLCKLLVGELPPDAGKITWGHEVSVGYIAQDHRESIPGGTTVDKYLHSFDEKAYLQDIRGLLGKMLFKGEEGEKPTEALSGGEAVRLLFARLMLTKDNVLVLDEPTNHLDLESIVALGEALARYEGTAFVVTHDRDLIDNFATRLWAFGPGGLTDFRGGYEEYLAQQEGPAPKKKGR
jgi:ATPase subunit of ABC transporter with duplicated ATPase domains